MKPLLITYFLFSCYLSFSQVIVNVFDNKFIEDKLILKTSIKNLKADSISIKIDKTRNVDQLTDALRHNQLYKVTHSLLFPASFVVYYLNDSIIDDEVYRTDHYLTSSVRLGISKNDSLVIDYANIFIGNKTLDLLRKKADLYFELHIIYYYDGRLIHTKTKRTRVLYNQ